jgi:hypothetical protein
MKDRPNRSLHYPVLTLDLNMEGPAAGVCENRPANDSFPPR